MKYGVYSQKAADVGGTILYQTPDGGLIHVTAVGNDPNFVDYHWDDKVLLGAIVAYVTRGRPRREPFLERLTDHTLVL